jgi:hypothetical protein
MDRRSGDNSVELEPQLYAQTSAYAEEGEDDTDDEDDISMAMEDEEGDLPSVSERGECMLTPLAHLRVRAFQARVTLTQEVIKHKAHVH